MTLLRSFSCAALAAAALAAFVGPAAASATTLEVGGVAQNKSVELNATLDPGTTMIFKDGIGATIVTCLESTIKSKTEGSFTGAAVGGTVGTLSFGNCTHTVDVIAGGSLSITWISGSTNGTVVSSGAEITVFSTVTGAFAICKTGAGTDIGVLTGATTVSNPTKHATIDVNAKISCGILGSSSWTGSYIVTSPTELGVVN